MENPCIYDNGVWHECSCRKRDNRVCAFVTEEKKCPNFIERGKVFAPNFDPTDTNMTDKNGKLIKIGSIINSDMEVVKE